MGIGIISCRGQNKGPEAGLLNKSSSLAATLTVTKFIPILAMNLITLLSCLGVQQTVIRLFNKSSFLAAP